MEHDVQRLAEELAAHGRLRHAAAHGHISHYANPVWGYSDAEALAGVRRVIAAVDLANQMLTERTAR